MQNYQELVQWLEGIFAYAKKDGLNNMIRLMDKLGNLQEGPAIIHVAGTNGKGSCCAMLTRILTDHGYRTGTYTSPHLVSYRERICIDGTMIPEADFVRIGKKVRAAAEAVAADGHIHPTFFEVLTAMAFCYFAEQKVDWIVLEAGVGGCTDATNIIRKPRLCLIASVSLDHTGVLGPTPERIADEKAGIIKEGIPVLAGHNSSGVCTVIKKRAAEMKAPYCYSGSAQYTIYYNDERGIGMDIANERWSYQNLQVSLCGDYQVYNVALVLEAVCRLREQGVPLREEKVRRSLQQVIWPGRMEFIPYGDKMLLLDGAHNEDGAGHLQNYLSTYGRDRSCTLLFSALAKKDAGSILRHLAACKNIESMIFAGLREDAHCMDGREAAVKWGEMGGHMPVLIAPDTATALRWAYAEDTDLIVCAGSLYLVGEVKEVLGR